MFGPIQQVFAGRSLYKYNLCTSSADFNVRGGGHEGERMGSICSGCNPMQMIAIHFRYYIQLTDIALK